VNSQSAPDHSKGPLPPLVQETMRGLVRGRHEAYDLPAAAQKAVAAGLNKCIGKPELVTLAIGLIELGYILDRELHSPSAAKALVEVVATFTDAIRAIGAQGAHAADALRAQADGLKRLTGSGRAVGAAPLAPAMGGGVGLRKKR